MYLSKKIYIKNWDYMKPEERYTVSVLKGGVELKDIDTEKISDIVVSVMYWRKANAIHKGQI